MDLTAARTYRFGRPVQTVFIATLLLGIVYSLALAYLERRLPITPTYTALEVVGGVIIALLPVALTARYEARLAGLAWQTYERMVIVAFVGTGTPILIWQLIEIFLRRIALGG